MRQIKDAGNGLSLHGHLSPTGRGRTASSEDNGTVLHSLIISFIMWDMGKFVCQRHNLRSGSHGLAFKAMWQ
jgi:hypothetical protein